MYFILNFKCNGWAERAASVLGISHILPGLCWEHLSYCQGELPVGGMGGRLTDSGQRTTLGSWLGGIRPA